MKKKKSRRKVRRKTILSRLRGLFGSVRRPDKTFLGRTTFSALWR